jgi:beta-phosphoglucomutase-like phosphatase (HAD superfamily)
VHGSEDDDVTPAAPTLPTAVVFDLDGTLVDSERVSRAAMTHVLAEDGHTLTDDDYRAVVGRAWPHTRSYLVERMGYDEDGLASYRDRVGAAFRAHLDRVVVFDDVARTLDVLVGAAVPLAVCTSSGRAYLERVLRLPQLADRFATTVAREDTDDHKPRPAPYLLAAARLGVRPGACVVVEDSPAGVAAARAAGMRVVGVDRGLGLDLAGADRVVSEVSPDVLAG